MQCILEVKDNEDKFLLEMLKHFRFVKTRLLSKENVRFITELQESVEQVKKAKKGTLKLQKAKDLINEL